VNNGDPSQRTNFYPFLPDFLVCRTGVNWDAASGENELSERIMDRCLA